MRRGQAIICALVTIFTAAAMPAWAENVVRWVTPEPSLTWDPHGSDFLYSLIGYRQVYESLTRTGQDSGLEPALATSWKLVNPTTWRFELRQGVRFHDGTPLTAEDVAFSIDRALGTGSQIKGRAITLEGATVVDPLTIEIRSKRPDPVLPMRLRILSVMSRAWADTHGVAVATPHDKDRGTYARDHTMGTGPFRLVEHERGGRTVLERHPDWWGAEQNPHEVDRIIWTAIADDHERTVALLHGEADFVQQVPPDAVEKVSSAPGLRLAKTPGLRVFWLGFNQGLDELPGSDVKGRNPFRDRRVREAVYRAIDVDALIRDTVGGLAVPAGMIVAPGVNGWFEELDRHEPQDLDGAKRLLAEAGYPDGFALRLSCMKSWEAPCRNVADQLGPAGLKVEVAVLPDDAHSVLLDSFNTGFYVDSFQAATTFDSAEVLRTFYHTGGWVEGAGYANPELDAKIEAIEGELSTYARDGLIEMLWQQLLADVVVVPLYRPTLVWAMREGLDVPINALNYPWFWRARVASPAAR